MSAPQSITETNLPVTFLDRARPLVECGIPVIPLKPKSKIAVIEDWPSKASTDLAQVEIWNSENPNYNCAAVAREDGKAWFFEVDNETVIPRLESETGKKMPDTFEVRSSPGHIHYYFKQNNLSIDLGNIAQGYVIGGDWSARVNNAYVVGPQSINPKTDLPYEVIQDRPVIAAPDWLLEWMRSQKINKNKPEETPRDINGLIPHGYIHDQCVAVAGKFVSLGMSTEGVEEALVSWATSNCAQPLDLDHVRQVARSTDKWKRGNPLENMILVGGKPAGTEPVPTLPTFDASSIPEGKDAPQKVVTPLVSIDGDKFMSENIPPRKVLLRTSDKHEPVFFGQSINQIFAWRGTGKTNVGLGLTQAFANASSFLNWEVSSRARVLYIEGEMPESQLQERWNAIVGKTGGWARLVIIDKQPLHIIPSLATQAGMDKVEATLAALETEGFKVEVLMLDSISTLFNVKANDEDTWIMIQAWLVSLRSRGLAVFFFHHSGKGGMSRSHSKSEDMLDISIKLESPKDKEGGCLHAIMTYDKTRGVLDEPSAEIKMRRTHSNACACKKSVGTLIGCRGDGVAWEYKATSDALLARAFDMFDEGASLSEVAKELKAPKSTVQYWKNKWEARGPIEPDAVL